MMDAAAATLLIIHYNLCCGTIAKFATERPDVSQLLDKLLKFEAMYAHD